MDQVKPDSKRSERLEWMDAVRGLATALIPIAHAAVLLESYGYATQRMAQLLSGYTAVGMALFFTIAGMNGRRAVDGEWRDCWRTRLAPMIWMLLVWVTIDWVLFRLIPNPRHPENGTHWWEIPLGWVTPSFFTWFLWSLIAYTVLARLVRHQSKPLVLACAGAATIIFLGATSWHLRRYGLDFLADYARQSACTYFLFFYLGYCYRDRILTDFTHWPIVTAFLGCTAGYIALMWVSAEVHFVPLVGALRLAAVVLGAVGAIYIGKALLLWEPVRLIMLRLGQLTLQIFLAHLLFLMPILWLVRMTLQSPSPATASIVAGACGVAATILSIGFMSAVQTLRLTWLFKAPSWLTGRPFANVVARPAPATVGHIEAADRMVQGADRTPDNRASTGMRE